MKNLPKKCGIKRIESEDSTNTDISESPSHIRSHYSNDARRIVSRFVYLP